MDWIEELRRLPPERRAVWHQPETPRYTKARQKLSYLVRQSVLLGEQPDPERASAHLLALWAPPESGSGAGYYSCFRVFLEEGVLTFAVLYCLYDGSERSPGFRSLDAARGYAEAHGFFRG